MSRAWVTLLMEAIDNTGAAFAQAAEAVRRLEAAVIRRKHREWMLKHRVPHDS